MCTWCFFVIPRKQSSNLDDCQPLSSVYRVLCTPASPPSEVMASFSAGWLTFHIFIPQTRNPVVYVLLVQLFLNGMRIHVTNCFLFSQRELMLLHAKAQEFAMEVQCCNWHPAECQLCIWIPMFVTQQKEPECISIYSNTTLIFKYFHDKQDS